MSLTKSPTGKLACNINKALIYVFRHIVDIATGWTCAP